MMKKKHKKVKKKKKVLNLIIEEIVLKIKALLILFSVHIYIYNLVATFNGTHLSKTLPTCTTAGLTVTFELVDLGAK